MNGAVEQSGFKNTDAVRQTVARSCIQSTEIHRANAQKGAQNADIPPQSRGNVADNRRIFAQNGMRQDGRFDGKVTEPRLRQQDAEKGFKVSEQRGSRQKISARVEREPSLEQQRCLENSANMKLARDTEQVDGGLFKLIRGLLPPTVYNSKTKKLFGILSAEDLLIAALIFLFLDSEEEGDPLLIIVLIYLLFSDRFDLSGIL